jgi:colicin import membrane protein
VALRFDRSKPGVWVSGAVHAALLAAGLVAFASERFPDAQEGIPVEIVTDNMVSEITRGEQTAKEVQPQPKPRAERVAERVEERDPGEAKLDAPAPPKRPVEAKVDDKPAEAAAPPTPPLRPVLDQPEPAAQPPRRPELAKAPEPPRREPEKKPEPPAPTPPKREELAKLIEREDAEAQAKAQAAEAKAHAEAERQRAEAERQKAEADARAKAAAEAQAKAEAERKKALAEAKAKAEAKARAEAKAKAEAEAKAQRQADLADKFDAGDIRKLLASREPSQSSGATGREVNRTASLGTATGNAQRLNPSQRDALVGILQEQLHKCWVVPVALQSAPNPPVPSVRVKLNPDGSLGAEPAVMNRSSDQLFGIAADSALRATRRCAPLRIPAQFQPYYQDWKDLVVNFNLRDMG